MTHLARRMILVAWLLGVVTLTSLWFLTPGTTIRISAEEAGQVVNIIGLESHEWLSGGVVLADDSYQVAVPFEVEVPSRLIGRGEITVVGGPGAPVSVMAIDKFGQTFRARGERVVVWQGPLASGGVAAGPIRTAQHAP